MEFSCQEQIAQWILHQLAQSAAQRTRTILAVTAFLQQQLSCRSSQLDAETVACKTLVQLTQHIVGNQLQLLSAQGIKDKDFVHTVQKFRTEHVLDFSKHLLLAVLALACLVAGKAQRSGVSQLLCAGVACHNQHGITEVYRASLTVGQTAILHNLQQQIKHIGMCLFDFIQKHYTVRLTAYRIRQLSALVIAYIARRCANQACCGVLFHVFRHIEAQHSAFIAKQLLCQCLRQLSFAYTGRTEEQEGTDRSVFVLKACAGTANSSAYRAHSLILTDNTLVQTLLQLQQTAAFCFGQTCQRNTGPGSNNLSHILRSYRLLHGHLSQGCRQLRLQLGLLVTQLRCLFVILLLYSLLLFHLQIFQLLLQLSCRRRFFIQFDTQTGTGLIHQVNSLIRQISVRNIAVAQLHCSLDSLRLNLQLVEFLITLAQSQQHRFADFRTRHINKHRLEASFQRSILFDMLAVFINRCCADNLQLSTRQRRFDNIGSIDTALGTACTDNGMQLVDKENNPFVVTHQL